MRWIRYNCDRYNRARQFLLCFYSFHHLNILKSENYSRCFNLNSSLAWRFNRFEQKKEDTFQHGHYGKISPPSIPYPSLTPPSLILFPSLGLSPLPSFLFVYSLFLPPSLNSLPLTSSLFCSLSPPLPLPYLFNSLSFPVLKVQFSSFKCKSL